MMHRNMCAARGSCGSRFAYPGADTGAPSAQERPIGTATFTKTMAIYNMGPRQAAINR